MTAESALRNKSAIRRGRFGLQLVWTQIKTPQALTPFTLLIGLTLLLFTAIGHALALRQPKSGGVFTQDLPHAG
jgi:hypothetical protein